MKRYWNNLKEHPGLPFVFILTLMCCMAIAKNKSSASLSLFEVIGVGLLCSIPLWLIVLVTNYTNNKQTLYYIKNSYVGNAVSWWGIYGNGYTTDIKKAGKYTREQAQDICRKKPSENFAFLCSAIDRNKKAHKMIIDGQYIGTPASKYFNELESDKYETTNN